MKIRFKVARHPRDSMKRVKLAVLPDGSVYIRAERRSRAKVPFTAAVTRRGQSVRTDVRFSEEAFQALIGIYLQTRMEMAAKKKEGEPDGEKTP